MSTTCFLCDVPVRKPRCKGERHLLQKCVRKQILGIWSRVPFCREAQGHKSLQCWLQMATSPCSGEHRLFEADHRPSLKKKFLNWLKDREAKTTSRGSSSSSLLSSGVAFEVAVQTHLRCGELNGWKQVSFGPTSPPSLLKLSQLHR